MNEASSLGDMYNFCACIYSILYKIFATLRSVTEMVPFNEFQIRPSQTIS